ncbi:hypothetical protein [Xenophilus sp. Marseille-Q4582]|uniref:hypothetical protein n=1 Tax=Xenophilus sp. Marseille-Q4582 TaxID=2866600 RepID=UPI001CE465E0|nr:hypothetical protein [Xenophilus sp. Marseille-Q4582]
MQIMLHAEDGRVVMGTVAALDGDGHDVCDLLNSPAAHLSATERKAAIHGNRAADVDRHHEHRALRRTARAAVAMHLDVADVLVPLAPVLLMGFLCKSA